MKQFFLIALLIIFSSCTDNYHTVIIPNDTNSQKETEDETEEDPDIDDYSDDFSDESEMSDDFDLSDLSDQSEMSDDFDLSDLSDESGMSDDSDESELSDNDFDYPPSETPPIDLEGIDAYYYSDISYAEDSANKFDLFTVKSESPTPVVIFIHGGGFTAGDKSEAYEAAGPFVIKDLLANGISFATINYRLLEQNDQEGIIKPLIDCKRALPIYQIHLRSLQSG